MFILVVFKFVYKCVPNVKIMIVVMFTIIAKIAYLFGMLFINFFAPVVSDHMPKISVRINVKRTEFNPNMNPDNIVINVNIAMVVL